MSYFVICTFDLKNASREDYANAYADLEKLGLSKEISGDGGKKVKLPTTITAGEFNGETASAVRDDLRSRIAKAFSARGFKSEIFLSIGTNWAWGYTTT